ncbi:MAG: malto-oligosyltrehalose trehalohydrolase [Nocardioidaceae bacterium]|nr:malto-oligosyltrehalose trehalohydrolase [Nocardioidaceae bacterium]NUS51003.1 malto-oligosyltrehalose trehalohydrolase [Nocardioidaceae bacterium]
MRVWAPHADRVVLVTVSGRSPMAPDGGGWWTADVELRDGDRYAFSLDGGDPRPDPRGLWLPDGPHGWTAHHDPAGYAWTDQDWRGRALEGAVVYETHVGTFTPEGTLDAAAERLPYLADLGVDVVELLPVATFPGRHNWGYDGVAPYSVHDAYGGPPALQRFVDAAHRHGLAVCLDVVYNHLGPDGNYLAELGPYFDDAYVTPWGQAVNLDGPDSDEVRRWVLDNVRQWLLDFHVDGLRLDAVHELHDDSALPILEEMSREVDALAEQTGRRLWLVAESDRNDPRTVTPRGEGSAVAGLGVHGQWADDVHHALHVALTGETQGYYADFADPEALAKVLRTPFFHDGTWSSFRGRRHGRPVDRCTVPGWRFVASLQTHDQVGNRARGDRLSQLVDPGLLACGAALLLTAPYTPMLFMGEEWGASTPWQFFTDHTDPGVAAATAEGRAAEFAAHGWAPGDVPDPQDPATFERSRLDWAERDREPHARLLAWYRDLLRLRREVPDLRDPDLAAADVTWCDRHLTSRRGGHLLLANLADEPWAAGVPGEVLLAWEEYADGVLRPRSAVLLRT